MVCIFSFWVIYLSEFWQFAYIKIGFVWRFKMILLYEKYRKVCINHVIHNILSNLYSQYIFTKYLFTSLFNMSREIKSTNLIQVKCYNYNTERYNVLFLDVLMVFVLSAIIYFPLVLIKWQMYCVEQPSVYFMVLWV
jgi:hypothetical protein